MTIQIGRLHIPGDVEEHSYGTRSVRFAGAIDASGRPEALHLAQQIVALGERAEDAVPVVLPDGWVGVGRVSSVDWSPLHWGEGVGRWQVEVEPVRSARVPRVESTITGSARPTQDPPDQVRGWCAVPGSARSWSWMPAASSRTEFLRPVEGGAVRYASAPNVTDSLGTFTVAAEDWYEGCVSVEVSVAGRWLPVVGLASIDRAEAWRVTNGLVRWTATPGNRLEVQWWREGTWRSTRVWNLICYLRDPIPWAGVQVTRNAAEAVTVRLTGQLTRSAAPGDVDWWVTVRRGSTALDMFARASADPALQLVPVPTGSVTDNTSHITSATVDGVAWVGMASGSWDHGGSTGIIFPTPLQETRAWSFAVAGQMPGVDGVGLGAEVVRSWYAAGTERLVVAG